MKAKIPASEMVEHIKKIALLFGVSEEQIKSQYAHNSKSLFVMAKKAHRTKKTVNGYTAKELMDMANTFKKNSFPLSLQITQSTKAYHTRATRI